ncbi:MAG: Gfo/Idh/MocA family oxidoreductase [Candidatus Sumerlaeota bacterium]|nr:Gfo/Idh/MocA family oxidoreductase [Candidatus Sumerlaeota bacterium]
MVSKRKGISRRDFVKRTATLAGLAAAVPAIPTIIPSSALGADGAVAPSNRVTLGMIGVGRQGHLANLKQFLTFPDVQIVAVNDVDSWRVELACDAVEKSYSKAKESGAYKGCQTFKDFRELLARPEIDAVMVSTPDHWHALHAIAAARAGKDVCCEKPLVRTIAEGRLLSDTVSRMGRVFRTDTEVRSLKTFVRAVELVLNGRIGKLHTIRTGTPAGDVGCGLKPDMPVPEEVDYESWQGPALQAPYTVDRVHPPKDIKGRPGWMRVRHYCDGMITNWGAHLNEIAQWGNGTDRTGPVEVEGTGEFPSDGLWNVLLSFETRMKFANGVNMIFKLDRPYTRFEGDEGWVEAGFSHLKAEPESILKSVIPPSGIHLPLIPEKRDWIDAIKTRGSSLMDAEIGHRTTSLCLLGYIAILRGKKLAWDPKAERFTNDEEANRMLSAPMRAPWHL